MKEGTSRREFLGLLVGAALLNCAVEERSKFKELKVWANEVYTIDNLQAHLTADIGIQRISLFSLIERPATFIFFEVSHYALPVSRQEREGNPQLKKPSGFVPYDPSFSIERALTYLYGQSKDTSLSFPARDLIDFGILLQGQRPNPNLGNITFFRTPQPDTEVMFVTGGTDTYLVTNSGRLESSPPAILKIKLRFLPSQTPKV